MPVVSVTLYFFVLLAGYMVHVPNPASRSHRFVDRWVGVSVPIGRIMVYVQVALDAGTGRIRAPANKRTLPVSAAFCLYVSAEPCFKIFF